MSADDDDWTSGLRVACSRNGHDQRLLRRQRVRDLAVAKAGDLARGCGGRLNKARLNAAVIKRDNFRSPCSLGFHSCDLAGRAASATVANIKASDEKKNR